MNRLILADEVASFYKYYSAFTKKHLHPPRFLGNSRKGKFLYKHFFVITDGNPMGKYMAACLDNLVKKSVIKSAVCLSVNDIDNKYDCFDYKNISFDTYDAIDNLDTVNEAAFLFFADCCHPENKQVWFDTLERVTAFAAKGKKNMCVLTTMLPEYPAIPQDITSLSEREFIYFLEREIENPTEEQVFYVELEKLCRKIVTTSNQKLNLVRVDNLFGPDANNIRTFDLENYINEVFESKKVVINENDYENVISLSYINPALCFATQMLYTGRTGQVYNFCSHTASIADIKATIRDAFKEQLSLETKSSANQTIKYRVLNTLKFYQCGWITTTLITLKNALYQTVCNTTGQLHNNADNVAIYAGKLRRIKDLELMMLKDIDDICRKHNIQYFLCGGTMLGAIRYGHSIPWDDDLDIGMLREDFDKFRKVCQEEHKDIYNYSSHINKCGAHYIVDKVRLNGTYFSTRFSSVHEYADGLFIDVLVYDKTTNNKLLGKLQTKLLFALSKIIEIRWYNKPRKNYYYKKSLIFLPLLRIFPLGFYHAIYEFLLKLFTKTKNAKYVIDSTGKLQDKGPFPIHDLEHVQYVDFDGGFKAPIPADYNNYLTFDYGPNYLPEPVLSDRCAPHNFARIDLGEYIFTTKQKSDYRDVNVHGELFEEEV
ncbi:MAG: LicD family protein [Clostridia bacterium]|nr:LicD family protein [Clostridia bacterium]